MRASRLSIETGISALAALQPDAAPDVLRRVIVIAVTELRTQSVPRARVPRVGFLHTAVVGAAASIAPSMLIRVPEVGSLPRLLVTSRIVRIPRVSPAFRRRPALLRVEGGP